MHRPFASCVFAAHFPVHPTRQQAEEATCDEMNKFAEPP